MNSKVFYILSVGLAFYAGMKFTKNKVVTKIITKTVKVDNPKMKKLVLTLQTEKQNCIYQYKVLAEESLKEIEDLKSQIDECEEKYYCDYESPHPNLEPEKVDDLEPEMGYKNEQR